MNSTLCVNVNQASHICRREIQVKNGGMTIFETYRAHYKHTVKSSKGKSVHETQVTPAQKLIRMNSRHDTKLKQPNELIIIHNEYGNEALYQTAKILITENHRPIAFFG